VLNRTFVHIPGIGTVTERRIWKRGVQSWDAFLRAPSAAGLSSRKTESILKAVSHSLERLRCEDYAYFSSTLASREHWRAYPDFSHRIAYIDIETTGMAEDDAITMIGLYDGREARVYTKGEDLQAFADDIGQYSLLVTFFGSGFDLPFLRRRFPAVQFDQLHIDLCYALRRLGHTGGLKHIEQELGIVRGSETEGLDGWDAVLLWREWERGSRDALQLLKAYNREDIVNLEELLRYAYRELFQRTGIPGWNELAAPSL